jgi:LuxR family maltose regulon positive regulatory protein
LTEYLLQEVVECQPAEIQRFLKFTAILERLCAPLCDIVVGLNSAGEDILHQLEHTNLFLVPLDDQGYWYRYHHLFRDFLITRLKQSEADRIPILHKSASEWFASQNLLSEAVSHAIATRDMDYAASVVEQYGMTIFNRSEISMLQKWCEFFPEEIFRSHPMLCILQAWPLGLSYRKEYRTRIEELLSHAEKFANALEDKQRGHWLISQAALARLSICLTPDPTTDPGQVIDFSQHILTLLSPDDPRVSLPTSAIGYAYMALQDLPMAWDTMGKYKKLSLDRGFFYGATAATFYLASIAFYQGELKQSLEICRQLKNRISEAIINPEQELPSVGSLDIIQGIVLLEEYQLAKAEQTLLHGLELVIGTVV